VKVAVYRVGVVVLDARQQVALPRQRVAQHVDLAAKGDRVADDGPAVSSYAVAAFHESAHTHIPMIGISGV